MSGESSGTCLNCGKPVRESWQTYCSACYLYFKRKGIDPANFVDSAGRIWFRANRGWRWSTKNKNTGN